MAEDTFDILIPDVTTRKPKKWEERLESVLGRSWELYEQ
jgi:hypothetical protein